VNMKIQRFRSERGMCVRLLATDYTNYTTVRSLWSMLDKRGYSMSPEAVRFHLDYLIEQGLVAAKRARDLESFQEDSTLSPDDIVMVKLAAKGLQLFNGAISDLEVTL